MGVFHDFRVSKTSTASFHNLLLNIHFIALPHNLSAVFDDAITNYERNIMIQTSAMKFNHRTIIALGSQSRLFIEIRCGVEDTGSRPRPGMLEFKAMY